jgi:hypothetical protein
MAAQPAAALGAVALTALAAATTLSTALVVAAVVLAAAAPLYLPAHRAGRETAPESRVEIDEGTDRVHPAATHW